MKPTKILIDWYSFTQFIEPTEGQAFRIMDKVNDVLFDTIRDEWTAIVDLGIEWEADRGRSPYQYSYSAFGGGLRVYVNPTLNHFLVEISGKGCAKLTHMGLLDGIISQTTDRTTRIDIAVDIQTETSPKEFLSGGYNEKFSSRSSISSKDGETEYIGSRKSERYCRVYKYNPPHKRAGWLRCEFVFKKKSAKIFAEQIAVDMFQMNRVANGCGSIYGFLHDDWCIDGSNLKITSYTPDRGDNKTLFWLGTSVKSAFKKLVKKGVIENPEKWLMETFIND